MAIASGSSIEAVLTLNASGFTTGIEKAVTSLKGLNDSSKGVRALSDALNQLESSLQTFNGISGKNLNTFSRLSTAVNKMANGLKILQSDAVSVEQGINTMNSIFKAFQGVLNGVEVKITGITGKFTQFNNAVNTASKGFKQYELGATDVKQASVQMTQSMNMNYASFEKVNAEAIKSREALLLYRSELMNLALGVEAFNSVETGMSARLRENQSALNQVAMADERVARLKQQVASATNQESSATDRNSSTHQRNASATNQQTTATKGLSRAMSSLRMMGTMVGSMIAYNFVHNLAMATTETINAKSEMNGYFQMLHYSKGQVDEFNRSLENTVKMFPRLNKYALGETISSIGVEFELTTQEMEKAMPVVSMITSEYLRAGRNVNEASLAVKDILQGEFQRLSRETGVKGDQLKEAGWSGDKNDVMGLLEALEKVGKSRNWDVFVEKANSLNDAVLILQNRFSEWSADMVERIQPMIVGVFNALMDVGGMFSQAFTGIIDWLGSGTWEASATQFAGLGVAIGVVSQALVMYRSEMGLVEASQLGLKGSILSLITGLKGQQVAEVGVLNSIKAKILGVNAEKVAQGGVTSAIQRKSLH